MTQSSPPDAEEPRYGARVSPEELEQILREQGIEPCRDVDPPVEGDPRAAGRAPLSGGDPYLRPGPGAPPSATGPVPGAPPPTAPWRTPQRRGRRRWRTLVTGLVLMLLIPFILCAAAVSTSLDGSLGSGASLGENGEVFLEAGQSRALYRTGVGRGDLECTVTDPAGAELELRGLEGARASYLAFSPTTTGVYTVSCAEGTSDVVVGPALKEGRIAAAGRLFLVALLSGMVGLVVSVVGLVRLLRR